MSSPSAATPVELEVGRIRELSKSGRHLEALASAELLAAAVPGNRDALYLIAANQRSLNRIFEALETLHRLEQFHPRFSLLYQERGHCYTTLRDAPRAITAFARAAGLNPALVTSWMMLERLYRITGEVENAAKAAGQVSTLKHLPADVLKAGRLFSDGELPAAENLLRDYLREANHVEALRLLGRIEHQRGLLDEAERLLESAVAVAPNYRAARFDYARVLIDRQKYPQAQEVIETLLELDPGHRDYLALSAAAFAGLGQSDRAIEVYRQLLVASPEPAELHVALGHCLKSAGRQKEAIESYRRATGIRSSFGDAYWSLANLKTYRFSGGEIAQMRAEEASPLADPVDRCHLCFALGKAYEDRGEYAESWQFYERGNGLKRVESHYDPKITETNTRNQIAVCTAQFFAARAGVGVPDPDPIFIVGLPRSGSTLIEQILASHSLVEGTQELPDLPRIASELGSDYPAALAGLLPEEFRRFAARYLTGARVYRKEKPFFVDKMPNNFRHIGLVHLILPNAKIIDVRREPMACCFSNWKQLFASGQEFTYSIENIARYYRSYLDLMRHWDAVLPGRVLRVCYESVVDDLEANVRRILEFCGLEFEPACIEFYKTERSVRTPSSEQVRRPIFRDALFEWRNYEPWIGALKEALGDARNRYRE